LQRLVSIVKLLSNSQVGLETANTSSLLYRPS